MAFASPAVSNTMRAVMAPSLRLYAAAEDLAQAAAELFVTLAASAIAARGEFMAALSGGATPRAMHLRLAAPDFAARVDWGRVHLFWGDERCVPPDHPDSSYRMARETLLDRLSLPVDHIHRIRGEIDPVQAADEYERGLRAFFASRNRAAPRFDLIFLGMGDDGHTASLFPGTRAVREAVRWVVMVEHTTPPAPLVARVTLTPAALNAAAHVAFLVSGAGKAARLREVLTTPPQPDRLPAQIVRPTDGELLWLVDAPAASGLPPDFTPA